MATFCLDCLNRMNQTNDSEKMYVISKHLELCEGCGKLKRVVIMKRQNIFLRILTYFILILRIIFRAICLLLKLLLSPIFLIYKKIGDKD